MPMSGTPLHSVESPLSSPRWGGVSPSSCFCLLLSSPLLPFLFLLGFSSFFLPFLLAFFTPVFFFLLSFLPIFLPFSCSFPFLLLSLLLFRSPTFYSFTFCFFLSSSCPFLSCFAIAPFRTSAMPDVPCCLLTSYGYTL